VESGELFAVLADRSRRRVLELVAQAERTVGDLVRSTRLRQPLVSHHLKVLRSAGLVTSRKEGRFRFYGISSPGVRALLEKLEGDAGKMIEAADAARERAPPDPRPSARTPSPALRAQRKRKA
jgi:DNA-binding transcriptional ArsR family regulator